MQITQPAIYNAHREPNSPFFSEEVEAFLRDTNELKEELISQHLFVFAGSAASRYHRICPPVYHSYSPTIFNVGNSSTTNYATQAPKDKEGGMGLVVRIVIGAIATAALFFSSKEIGRFWSVRQEAVTDLRIVQRFVRFLERDKKSVERQLQANPSLFMIHKALYEQQVTILQSIAHCRAKVFEQYAYDASIKLACYVGIVAGSTFALMGAFTASTTLISVGTLVTIGAVAIRLVKWGFDQERAQTQNKKIARQLTQWLNLLEDSRGQKAVIVQELSYPHLYSPSRAEPQWERYATWTDQVNDTHFNQADFNVYPSVFYPYIPPTAPCA